MTLQKSPIENQPRNNRGEVAFPHNLWNILYSAGVSEQRLVSIYKAFRHPVGTTFSTLVSLKLGESMGCANEKPADTNQQLTYFSKWRSHSVEIPKPEVATLTPETYEPMNDAELRDLENLAGRVHALGKRIGQLPELHAATETNQPTPTQL